MVVRVCAVVPACPCHGAAYDTDWITVVDNRRVALMFLSASFFICPTNGCAYIDFVALSPWLGPTNTSLRASQIDRLSPKWVPQLFRSFSLTSDAQFPLCILFSLEKCAIARIRHGPCHLFASKQSKQSTLACH